MKAEDVPHYRREAVIEYYHPDFDPCNFSLRHVVNKSIDKGTQIISHSTQQIKKEKKVEVTLQDLMKFGHNATQVLSSITHRFYKSKETEAKELIKSNKKGMIVHASRKVDEVAGNLYNLSTSELYTALQDKKVKAQKYLNNLKEMNAHIKEPSLCNKNELRFPSITQSTIKIDEIPLPSTHIRSISQISITNPTEDVQYTIPKYKTRNTSPHTESRPNESKDDTKYYKVKKSRFFNQSQFNDIEKKEFINVLQNACTSRNSVSKITKGYKIIRPMATDTECKNMKLSNSVLDKYCNEYKFHNNKIITLIEKGNQCLNGEILQNAVTFRKSKHHKNSHSKY